MTAHASVASLRTALELPAKRRRVRSSSSARSSHGAASSDARCALSPARRCNTSRAACGGSVHLVRAQGWVSVRVRIRVRVRVSGGNVHRRSTDGGAALGSGGAPSSGGGAADDCTEREGWSLPLRLSSAGAGTAPSTGVRPPFAACCHSSSSASASAGCGLRQRELRQPRPLPSAPEMADPQWPAHRCAPVSKTT